MHGQRGFTLVEVLVATAIAAMLAIITMTIARAWTDWSARTSLRANAYAALDTLEDRLDAESATAWSVFVPVPNELDFATRDARHRSSFRAIRYDPSLKTLTTYAYGTPDDPPIVAGIIAEHVDAFDATTTLASTSGDPLFAGATVADATIDLGFGIPEALGGNRLTLVTVMIDGMQRRFALASATAPSNVTVVLRYTPAP